MEGSKIVFYLNLLGHKVGISQAIVVQWIIILICLILCVIFTSNLKKIPGKKQAMIEIFVEKINDLVKNTMGEDAIAFVPYIGTLVVFLLLMNLAGLIGIKPPTQDFSVTSGLAAISFIVIQAYAIRKQGVPEYLGGYARPIWFLLPINIMERVMLPVSLTLRLFGNMTAAVVIVDLIYSGLSKTPLGIFQIGIPVPVHAYFDVFDGTLQMIIFVMLTMINIKIVSEE